MITPKISYIKELVEPEHQLFHHRIQSCSYNLNRQELSKILVDNMIHHEVMVCFNPRIVKSYAEEVEMEEGCLSYPDLFLKIKRPDKIVVKYEDENKKTHKMKLEGLASRVFQHEYDHMEGIDFTQRS